MRPLLPVLSLAAVVVGCSRTPLTINVSVTQTSPDAAAASAPPVSQPAELTYPEKSEVEALLYRARELRQKGKFESALTLVNQALQYDPHSPAATALKTELEEIIKRI